MFGYVKQGQSHRNTHRCRLKTDRAILLIWPPQLLAFTRHRVPLSVHYQRWALTHQDLHCYAGALIFFSAISILVLLHAEEAVYTYGCIEELLSDELAMCWY